MVIPLQHFHWWGQPYFGSIGTYYGNSGGLLGGMQQQLQTYGAATIVDAPSHVHEEDIDAR